MKKYTSINLLPCILCIYLSAMCPAVFAQQIHLHKNFEVTQSEAGQGGENANSMDKLLEEAYLLEKDGDFKSAISLYGDAIVMAKSQNNNILEIYLIRKKGTMFLFSSQLDSAQVYFQTVNNYAKRYGIDTTLAKVLVNQGYLANKEGENAECLLYYDSALVIFEKIKDTLGIASVMNNKALYYKGRGEYAKALENALKNESLLSGGKDKLMYVAGLITLGNIYEKLDEYDTALVVYERTYALSSENDFNSYANTSLTNIAVIYYRQEKFDDAELAFLRAIEFSEKNDDKASLALLYSNIGLIYRKLGKTDLALQSFLKSLQIAKEINDEDRMVSVYNNLGIFYKTNKKFSQAIKYYNESLALSINRNRKADIEKTYSNLAGLYYETEDYKKAFTYLNLANTYQDSVLNEQKVRAIEEMKAKYEKEKNMAQIKSLQDEKKIDELEKKSIRAERNSALGILSTIVFLLVIILLYFRMKSRKNRIIDAQRIQQLEDEKKLLAAQSVIVGQENERKRIAQELHDGIGVLLSTASIHFSVVSKTSKDKKTVEMLDKAEKLLKQAGGEVRKISQNMMPVVLSKFGLIEALEDMFEKLDELDEMDVSANFSGENGRLPENTEIMLYRIIQEMVNNTLKHAKAKHIEFSYTKVNGIVLIDYKDDGVGFDIEKLPHNSSLGVFGIRSRVDFLKGKLKFESAIGKGTYYHVSIPVNN